MEGLKLTAAEILEILSVYSASEHSIPAVVVSPGWHVVGAFRMSLSYSCRVAVVGSVSQTGLVLRARLFDLTVGAAVPGTVSITDLADKYATTPPVDLLGQHVYQMQVEVTGGASELAFGTVRAMQLVA